MSEKLQPHEQRKPFAVKDTWLSLLASATELFQGSNRTEEPIRLLLITDFGVVYGIPTPLDEKSDKEKNGIEVSQPIRMVEKSFMRHYDQIYANFDLTNVDERIILRDVTVVLSGYPQQTRISAQELVVFASSIKAASIGATKLDIEP